MEKRQKNQNYALFGLAALLLAVIVEISEDAYKRIPCFQSNVVTIGVFSDSYWDVQNGYSYQILEDAIDLFEKENPGIRVDYVSGILKEDYSEWLSEQLLLGTAPDVFFVLGEDFNEFAEIGALRNLASLIDQDEEFQAEDYYTSAYRYGQYRDMQYALPYECAPKLMFVNRTILDREGIALPEEDWTWDDFYDICDKVTKDTDGNGVIDQFGTVGYTWQDALESNGIRLFNQMGTECYLSDDNMGDVIDFIERLESLNQGFMINSREFDLGNVAFQPMSFSEYRAYKPYPLRVKKYSGFEWECVTMPAGPNGDNISKLDTLLIGMNENTSNTEYAWKLMKILTGDSRIQSEIFDYSEGVSVLKEVTRSENTLQQLMEGSGEGNTMNLRVLNDAVENAVVISRFRNYDQAIEQVDQAIQAIIENSSNISMGQIVWNRKINSNMKSNQ